MNTENKMTEKDWDEIDRSSRTLVKQWLKSIGMSNIADSHGNCCYDLTFVGRNGVKVAVEIKDRTFRHDKYGDIFAEDIKQECNNRRMANGEFDKALAVNVFTDNVFAVANLNDKDAKHSRKYCPYTSMVKGESKEYVVKDVLSLPQRLKIRFQMDNNGYKFTKM